MMKAYKFRLYPSNDQMVMINKTLDCARYVYNYYLAKRKEEYHNNKKTLSCFDCIKDLSQNLIKENPWLKETDSMSLRCVLFDLDNAFQRMFQFNNGYPNFKSKYNNKKTYRTNYVNNNIRVDMDKRVIRLPKLKEVKIRGYRKLKEINGKIKNATISKESNNKYYVSVVVEEDIFLDDVNISNIIGIDLGIKNIITTSDGEKYRNERIINKYEKRIKRYQRQLSRKEKESKNYYKIKNKIAILYSKLHNTRKYLVHAITSKIVKENKIIVAETLTIKNMTKNHKLAKSINDVTWYEIIRQLGYKSKWKNKKFYQIDTFYPSSQECSICGKINVHVKDLNIREWECEECRNSHDRDINAAINIMYEGIKRYMKEIYL